MKIKTLEEEYEPYLVRPGVYKICSAERIDIRPGETRDVYTGLEVLAYKKDEAKLVGANVVNTEVYGRGYMELKVPMKNTEKHNITIYPGDYVARLKFKVEKRTTFSSSVRFVEE